jgi:hypothetical protein
VVADQRQIHVDRVLAEPPTGGIAWLMLETKVGPPDHDMQLLLLKLSAHTHAMKLLHLPFERRHVRRHEVQLRLMLTTTYRLLKAMAVDFPLVQGEVIQASFEHSASRGSPLHIGC